MTDEGSTVTEAKATIASDFAPEPVPGNDIFLTSIDRRVWHAEPDDLA